jgi:hypothetical protein
MNEVLEYTVTADDWGAFGEHQARTLGAMKRQTRIIQVFGGLLVAAIAVATWIWFDSVIWLVAMGIAGIWAISDVPKSMRNQARKHMIRMYNEGKAASTRGLHRMEATPGGIMTSTDLSESITRWDAIEGLSVNDTHAFFDLGAGLGTAVPRAGVVSGNFDAFFAKVRDYMQK